MTNIIEKRIELKAPVSRVWRALTDHREFGQWFRVKLEGPFVPGEVSRGQITYPGYEHIKWEADRAEDGARAAVLLHLAPLRHRSQCRLFGRARDARRVQARTEGGGTLLTVTETGFDAIPKDRQFEAYRMNEAGWTEQLQNIERHVKRAA